jgi:hypothetical protein
MARAANKNQSNAIDSNDFKFLSSEGGSIERGFQVIVGISAGAIFAFLAQIWDKIDSASRLFLFGRVQDFTVLLILSFVATLARALAIHRGKAGTAWFDAWSLLWVGVMLVLSAAFLHKGYQFLSKLPRIL